MTRDQLEDDVLDDAAAGKLAPIDRTPLAIDVVEPPRLRAERSGIAISPAVAIMAIHTPRLAASAPAQPLRFPHSKHRSASSMHKRAMPTACAEMIPWEFVGLACDKLLMQNRLPE